MSDPAEPIARLDRYFAATRIAHEVIADLHRELVSVGQADQQSRELLRESARITLGEMPALAENARDLNKRWTEQEILDPDAAD